MPDRLTPSEALRRILIGYGDCSFGDGEAEDACPCCGGTFEKHAKFRDGGECPAAIVAAALARPTPGESLEQIARNAVDEHFRPGSKMSVYDSIVSALQALAAQLASPPGELNDAERDAASPPPTQGWEEAWKRIEEDSRDEQDRCVFCGSDDRHREGCDLATLRSHLSGRMCWCPSSASSWESSPRPAKGAERRP